VIVIAGGDAIDPRLRAVVPDGAHVIAADSGADHALALGLRVDELIGDLDSVQSGSIDAIASAGGAIDRHPSAKNFTDLELALQRAVALGPPRIVVLGGHGERDDHHLANRLLLGAPFLAATEVVAWSGRARITAVRTTARFRGPEGSLLSLLAVGGPAGPVRTTGLRYPLDDEILEPGSTRGVSNELVAAEAEVTTGRGVLLAVQPDAIDHLASMTGRELS
jgi:thiamine pyrophosphokinase